MPMETLTHSCRAHAHTQEQGKTTLRRISKHLVLVASQNLHFWPLALHLAEPMAAPQKYRF
jgi:hypothetical protein